ncbi:MAG: sugar phosphate isomerase/epimerase family protein [Christensenellales bacterium]|jgi:sugar phosphate isomerase/epimerase
MMEFGMPTLIEHASLGESAALCRELGLQFVEINMNLPAYQVEKLDAGALCAEGGVYYTLHLDEDMNPFGFNPAVALAYRATARAAVRIAHAAGMPIVNMHMPQGVHFKLPGGKVYLFDRYWDDVRDQIARFRDDMTRAAGDSVAICVENTTFCGFSHLPDALDLLLESPAFQLTYDCGHDHVEGGVALPFYAAHSGRLRHFHLHDASDSACHLTLGAGEVDIRNMLRMAHGCRVVIETKDAPGLGASVNWLIERNFLP